MENGPLDLTYPPHGMPGAGTYNATPPAYTDGAAAQPQYDQSGNQKTNTATLMAGEDIGNDVMKVETRLSSTNLTASAVIKTGTGVVRGVIVNSHTSGTLKLWDNTAASGTVIIDTYTFPAGPSVVNFGAEVQFATGLYATIGGTANLTILWR